MSAQHTSTPWELKFFPEERGEAVIVTDAGECVLDVFAGRGRLREFEANARLVAAAPELLEALQTLVDEYEPNLKAFATDAPRKAKWMAALSVIAKATGGPA